MNFASDGHYEAAVDALAGLGLPLREKEDPRPTISAVPHHAQVSNAPLASATPAPPEHPPALLSQGSSSNPPAPGPALPAMGPRSSVLQTAPTMAQGPLQISRAAPLGSHKALQSITQVPRLDPADDLGPSSIPTGNVLIDIPARDAVRDHTSHGKLETAAPEEDHLRRTLFPSASTKQRPVSAPVPGDPLNQMLPPQRVLPFVEPDPKPSKKPTKKPQETSRRRNGLHKVTMTPELVTSVANTLVGGN